MPWTGDEDDRHDTTEHGDVATTSYDAAGRVASVTDPKGTTSYTCDGTDANGKPIHLGVRADTRIASRRTTDAP